MDQVRASATLLRNDRDRTSSTRSQSQSAFHRGDIPWMHQHVMFLKMMFYSPTLHGSQYPTVSKAAAR